LIVEVTGDEEKILALEMLLRPFGIKEMVRTGIIAMARGSKTASKQAASKQAGNG
jgi:acetolactate synthase-1/3 small subunit